jgi:hypothetical protein
VKVIGKNVSDINDLFACLTCLDRNNPICAALQEEAKARSGWVGMP